MNRLARLGYAGVLVAGLILPAAQASFAQDGATLYQTKTCIACHGKDAKTPLLPDYPKLAGQNKAYLLRQMQDIKSGARSNANTAAMKGVMPIVTDQDMVALAEYIATLK